jgi:hypothetical protein
MSSNFVFIAITFPPVNLLLLFFKLFSQPFGNDDSWSMENSPAALPGWREA